MFYIIHNNETIECPVKIYLETFNLKLSLKISDVLPVGGSKFKLIHLIKANTAEHLNKKHFIIKEDAGWFVSPIFYIHYVLYNVEDRDTQWRSADPGSVCRFPSNTFNKTK